MDKNLFAETFTINTIPKIINETEGIIIKILSESVFQDVLNKTKPKIP